LPGPGVTHENASEDSEETLSHWMQAAQAGDGEAYQRLLVAIRPKIQAIVRSRIRDPAAVQDVIQNALLAIHRGRASYRPERPFGPWMRAIVRNSVVDHYRERKRRGDRETVLDLEAWPDERSGAARETEPLAPELRAALEALPAAQREAVSLIQVEGLSVAEAALRAGVSPGALKVRAHRGYRALRERLDGARRGGIWLSEEPPKARGEAEDRGAG
jgi:RNA polymerase sigma-70 factor (ECF subfamily)